MIQPPAMRTTSTTVISATPTGEWNAPATSTILAASRQQSASAKVGRIVSAGVAPAVTEGKIQPAAVAAIALDEPELTPDMVALQSVVPTPRPDRPIITMASAPAASTAALAYASAPNAVASLKAMEFPPAPGEPLPSTASEAPPELAKLIKRYAGLYGVPESLVHRVVHRESKYDPKAYHKNGYWGLMQITYSTAKSMGYEGPPSGLLDAETNLKYAIKYLRGAWLVADNQNDSAIKLYARGYYLDAKRKDMLHVLEK
jgi:soluble lytic murein transglycosylase-like protein